MSLSIGPVNMLANAGKRLAAPAMVAAGLAAVMTATMLWQPGDAGADPAPAPTGCHAFAERTIHPDGRIEVRSFRACE